MFNKFRCYLILWVTAFSLVVSISAHAENTEQKEIRESGCRNNESREECDERLNFPRGRTSGAHTTAGDKIVKGIKVSQYSDYSYQAALSIKIGQHLYRCGGIVIHERWILSAAHCVESYTKEKNVKFSLGQLKYNSINWKQAPKVSKIIRHPLFNSKTYENDVLLLKLEKPAQDYWEGAEVIELHKNTALSSEAGDNLHVSGWGKVCEAKSCKVSNDLLYTKLKYVRPERCKKGYPKGFITNDMLCAGYNEHEIRDSCQGDSGGPLAIRIGNTRILVGIVSWGDGCARPNSFGVYSRVQYHRAWILKQIKNDSKRSEVNAKQKSELEGLDRAVYKYFAMEKGISPSLKVTTSGTVSNSGDSSGGNGKPGGSNSGGGTTDPDAVVKDLLALLVKMPKGIRPMVGSHQNELWNNIDQGNMKAVKAYIKTNDFSKAWGLSINRFNKP